MEAIRIRLALVDKAIQICNESDNCNPEVLKQYRQQKQEILKKMNIPAQTIGLNTLKLSAKRG